MPEYLRPREKMLCLGVDKLSEQDLLAIILGHGCKDEDVYSLSFRILKDYDKDFLLNCDVNELIDIKGLGVAKATRLKACFELSKRLYSKSMDKALVVNSEVIAASVIKENSPSDKKEWVMVLMLDGGCHLLGSKIISLGGLNSVLLTPREVYAEALKKGAKAIILSHNHPSGNSNPSQKDIDLTIKIQKAGELLDIELVDHIILSKNDFYSFKKCSRNVFT